jgi:hypothetical protein
MPSFKDRKGNDWQVQLDAVIIQEIKEDHGISLVNLESDPLLKLRNDPMALVACVSVICRDQQKEMGITPMDFAKLLPSPPDAMLGAVRDAVIGFFPSGRASHVREVLAKFDQMSATTDRLAETKMAAVIDNPKTMAILDAKADEIMEKAMKELQTMHVGTADSMATT